MSVLGGVLAAVVALGMLGAGVGKVARSPSMVKSAEHLGFSSTAYLRIGVLEIVAAAALVIGIWVPILGVLAAVGVVLLLLGAVINHHRAGDGLGDLAPALVLGVVAAAAVVRQRHLRVQGMDSADQQPTPGPLRMLPGIG